MCVPHLRSTYCICRVHFTHMCTLKAQLYLARSQWHPQYFQCPCSVCRVCVFIVSHHFWEHLLDPVWGYLQPWDLCGRRGSLYRVSILGRRAEAKADSSQILDNAALPQSAPPHSEFGGAAGSVTKALHHSSSRHCSLLQLRSQYKVTVLCERWRNK